MSTQSTSNDPVFSLSNPENIIRNRRRNLGDLSLLLDFEEINMANNNNNVQGPPHVGPNIPALDLRPMGELLLAPTDGVGDAIVVLLVRAARTWLEKEPPNSITTWNDLVSKFVNQFFPPSRTINLRNEITRFQQRFDETFSEAWDRFKDLLNKCPHHGFSHLHKIDTFCNGLSQSDQDCLNSGAGGNLLTRNTQEDLTIIENKSKIKAITTHSGIVLAGPSFLPPSLSSSSKEVEREPEPTMDQLSKRNPHQPPVPYLSRLNKEKLQDKSDIQIHKFLQMFKKHHFNISLAEALALMPKYAKFLKDLLFDKEKLLGLANTSLTENCSAVLLKKLPEKLGDPGRFLIPCDFHGLESCMALADLGASINLMPLSVWKKLSLPDLTPTRMTLELAT
ncbi:reverse transcriptase domain-containing protein [Tanacetum coccineum]